MTFTATNFSVSSNFVQEPRFCTIFSLYQDLSSISICHVAFLHVFFQVSDSHIGPHTGYPSNPIIHPRFSSDFMGVGISPSPPIPSGTLWCRKGFSGSSLMLTVKFLDYFSIRHRACNLLYYFVCFPSRLHYTV